MLVRRQNVVGTAKIPATTMAYLKGDFLRSTGLPFAWAASARYRTSSTQQETRNKSQVITAPMPAYRNKKIARST